MVSQQCLGSASVCLCWFESITGDVWFRAVCMYVCVCVSERHIVFGIGCHFTRLLEWTNPLTRGFAEDTPLSYARTYVSVLLLLSLCTLCFSPRLAPSPHFILYRKNVYVKLLFWHTGVGTATDRCFKHLVGFREGWLTEYPSASHARYAVAMFQLAPSLDSSAERMY